LIKSSLISNPDNGAQMVPEISYTIGLDYITWKQNWLLLSRPILDAEYTKKKALNPSN
jgi:hypothetical protein